MWMLPQVVLFSQALAFQNYSPQTKSGADADFLLKFVEQTENDNVLVITETGLESNQKHNAPLTS